MIFKKKGFFSISILFKLFSNQNTKLIFLKLLGKKNFQIRKAFLNNLNNNNKQLTTYNNIKNTKQKKEEKIPNSLYFYYCIQQKTVEISKDKIYDYID